MEQSSCQSLEDYINQYQGQIRYVKLLALIDKNPSLRVQAFKMCHDLAIKEKKLW